MKWWAVVFLGFSSFSSIGAGLYPEYNTWYSQDGVLYDMTQTSTSQPVLISISMAGYNSANMVVSYFSDADCQHAVVRNTIKINNDAIPAQYHCVDLAKGRIEHFVVNDASRVNGLVNNLRSDFTVTLQDEIRVWAANIRNPRYGMAAGL